MDAILKVIPSLDKESKELFWLFCFALLGKVYIIIHGTTQKSYQTCVFPVQEHSSEVIQIKIMHNLERKDDMLIWSLSSWS